jgi:glutamate-1-semialdehyde 2,1-aminomutase
VRLVGLEVNDAQSGALYERARRVLVGGVNSPVRSMRAIGRLPLFIDHAAGAEIVDVDGNRYVDYVCSWGPLIAGHAEPSVVAAIVEAAARGTTYGAPTEGEVILAEEVARRMPGAEVMRMTSSGTEAAMTALRLARAHTAREVVIKFAGAYHGHSDGLLAQAGSGLATQSIPASPGVPSAAAAATVVVPWNDRDALSVASDREDLAAIIAEPCPANMGLIRPAPGFLELLRERADAVGALLIFDEVISGFRVDRAGAGRRAGVQADLLVLGKILGGGLPAAALAGRRELMERLAPVGDVYQAGTLSGNPLAVAAGLATLALLDEEAYARLAKTTDTLAQGLRAAAGDLPVSVVSTTGLLTVFFAAQAPRNLREAEACDTVAYGRFCRELLARGVYPPPSQFEAWFPSLAHREEHVEQTLEAARAAFAAVGEGL